MSITAELQLHADIHPRIEAFTLPETLGFGRVIAPIMYRAIWQDGVWVSRELLPYGPLALDPAAKVLHYAQEIFEGLKAYKTADGVPTLFRPDRNFHRFNDSADRMCMPQVPESIFIEGVELMTAFMAGHIPGKSGESLYLRPFMIGVDAALGLGTSSRNEFYVIASPSGAYQEGNMKVLVEREETRASLGGTGHVKVGGNYAAALSSASRTKAAGFDQSLWLDPEQRRYIEELSGMNFFAVIGGELHTPELSGSILPGITRDSLLKLAPGLGFPVVERRMAIDELLAQIQSGECSECFACGTAAIITPISDIGERSGTRLLLPAQYPVAQSLRKALMAIQEGKSADEFAWVHPVPAAETFASRA